MTPTGPSVDLFLSYNRADADAVRRVCDLVQLRGFRTFLDSNDLTAGLPWPIALERAIGTAGAVAVFVGAAGLGAWQKREMYYALDLQTRTEQSPAGNVLPVIPVLLAGADVPAGFLAMNTWVDLRNEISAEALGPLFQALGETVDGSVREIGLLDICPYRDLRAFREEDAALFFGRDAIVEKIGQLLDASVRWEERSRFVAVVGPSGSGKSSIVMAGVRRGLRRNRPPQIVWDHVSFAPGDNPWRRFADALLPMLDPGLSEARRLEEAAILSEALRREDGVASAIRRVIEKSNGSDRLLVVVDQFEELFTLTADETARGFIRALFDASRSAPMTVLVTLRSDYYGRAIAIDRDLSNGLPDCQVNLGPIRREELREVIEKPAAVAGLEFEEGLVDRILDDVGDEPGNLPLLEYALTELWKARSGGLMTFAAYRDVGEVSGALAKRANALLAELSEPQKAAARRLMMRLVRVSAAHEEGADTRRRARRGEIDDEAWKLVDFFAGARARLLVAGKDPVSGADTVEVAHEALIRKWNRLREWLAEDRQFLLWRQRLVVYRNAWEDAGREDAGTLLRGGLAAEAQTWLRSRRAELSAPEREYIEKSGAVVSRFRFVWRAAAAMTILAGMLLLAWFLWSLTDRYNINRILAKGWEEQAVVPLARYTRQVKLRPIRIQDVPDLVALFKLGREGEINNAIAKLEQSERIRSDWHGLRRFLDDDQPKFRPGDLRHEELQRERNQQRSLGGKIELITGYLVATRAMHAAKADERMRSALLSDFLEQIRGCPEPVRQRQEPEADLKDEVAALSQVSVSLSNEDRALTYSTAARAAACEGAVELTRDFARQAGEMVLSATGDNRTQVLLDLAVADAMIGNAEQSVAAAQGLPPAARAFDEVGVAFARRGDIDAARRVLARAKTSTDSADDLIAAIAKELILQKRVAEVQTLVMKQSTGDGRFKVWRGCFEDLVANGHLDEAIRFAQAMKKDAPRPMIVDVFSDLCVILCRVGRLKEAAAAYDVAAGAAAADTDPSSERDRVSLAIALAEQGRIRRARVMAETLKNLPNQSAANLGILRAYTGVAPPSELW
jgi:KaiC/GvpD/RAD55 family RecA-like ATPase